MLNPQLGLTRSRNLGPSAPVLRRHQFERRPDDVEAPARFRRNGNRSAPNRGVTHRDASDTCLVSDRAAKRQFGLVLERGRCARSKEAPASAEGPSTVHLRPHQRPPRAGAGPSDRWIGPTLDPSVRLPSTRISGRCALERLDRRQRVSDRNAGRAPHSERTVARALRPQPLGRKRASANEIEETSVDKHRPRILRAAKVLMRACEVSAASPRRTSPSEITHTRAASRCLSSRPS